MRRILIILIITGTAACGNKKRTNHTTLDENGNSVLSKTSKNILADLVEECEACKAKSTKNLLDCKYITAKALDDFYEIDDFEKAGEYIDYNEMHDIILGKLGTWEYLGSAKEQDVLKIAQEKANNGQATVAVSTASPYGHVALIVPGHLKEGKNWGLKVPNSASFFLLKNLEAYADKPLNYSWRSNEDISIYTRKL